MSKKVYTGQVISDKMDKTVVVAVTSLTQHHVYKKTIRKVAKFKADDRENKCKTGDMVSIIESKPFSKDKRWKVLDIIRRGSE